MNEKREDDNPFFFVKGINKTKEDLMTNYNKKNYNSFLVNKSMSFFPDTVLYANEMNKAHKLPVNMQYDFYRLGVSKRNRFFGKWPKDERDENVRAIASFFELSYIKALELKDIFSKTDLEDMVGLYKKKVELNKNDL